MDFASLSSNLLLVSFIAYLSRNAIFWWSRQRRKIRNSHIKIVDGEQLESPLQLSDFLLILGYFITRWIASGHAPVSNMFEFVRHLG